MAHTNATVNYELSQFLGTDKPAWLVDYNGDMLKIDAALKANADAEAASAEDIQELQDAIGAEGLTGRITDIENDIGDIKTEIGSVSLPTTAQSLTGAIAELKGVNDDQNTAIGLNATNIAQVGGAVEGVSQLAYTIANVYDSSATYAVGDYAIYQNTLYKCTTAINVGEVFDPAKWTSVKVMSEVGQGGGGGSASADDVSYDNTQSGLSATNVQAAIDEVVSLIPSAGGPDVHVTSDGTINLRQFFKNVADAVDFTKVGKNTRLVEKRGAVNSLYVLTNLTINDVDHTISGGFSTATANGLTTYSFIISKTLANCYAYSCSINTSGNTTCVDQSTVSTSNGDYIDLYY